MRQFAGKVAVAMGGGGVLGSALARRFAREEMAVVLADADADALAETQEQLLERGAVTRTRRPGEFMNPGDEEQAERDSERYQERLAVSQSRTDYPTAAEIAADVLDAIREQRFYIISRPEIAHAIAQARAEAIVDGRAPTTAGMQHHQRHEPEAPGQG